MIKRALFLRPVITDRLKQPDHPFLDQIIRISADQKHDFRLFSDQMFVLVHKIIHNLILSVPQTRDQFFIRTLPLFRHRPLLGPAFL